MTSAIAAREVARTMTSMRPSLRSSMAVACKTSDARQGIKLSNPMPYYVIRVRSTFGRQRVEPPLDNGGRWNHDLDDLIPCLRQKLCRRVADCAVRFGLDRSHRNTLDIGQDKRPNIGMQAVPTWLARMARDFKHLCC